MPYEEKHPVILLPDSHFTLLVARSYHHRSLQLTLNMIRQSLYTERTEHRQEIDRPLRDMCALASRDSEAVYERTAQGKSDPVSSVSPPWSGLCGTHSTEGRGHKAYMAFIVVFVCLSTRAVHLEAVSDYIAEAFLATFRKFVSRRGL